MAFKVSSSTLKEIMPDGDFDENGVNLKLSLGQPSSLDLQLYLNTAPVHKCQVCKRTETPIWRAGPKGMRTLCNACGLKYKKFKYRRQTFLANGKPMWFAKGIDREFVKLISEANRRDEI